MANSQYNGSWLVARGSWSVIKKSVKFVLKVLFRLTIPIGKVIIFESNPDFACNTYPVYKLLKKFLPDYKMVWLIKDDTVNKDADDTVKFCGLKNFREKLINRVKYEYYMLRCKVLICCNIAQIKYKRNQISIFLCHGSDTKNIIGMYDSQMFKFDYIAIQSHFFDKTSVLTYNCGTDKFIYPGYPRCDYFYNELVPNIAEIITGEKISKFIIWMPTFRGHNSKDRDDAPGSVFNNIGVPLIYSVESLKKFNAFLSGQNIHILYKPHPAQDLDVVKKETLSNFHIIYDPDILSKNLQPYQLIAQSQALITDYSSIFWDYLLLDRPIAVTVDDLESWKKGRGFIVDFERIHDESAEKLSDENMLRKFILNVVNKLDIKQEGRRKYRDLTNIHQDGSSALRVANFILEKLGRRKKIIGFTDGVYDMFHVGHLNMLQEAKKHCDYLIVGVHSDEIVENYKHHKPIISENERQKIIESIKYVDESVINQTRDKLKLWEKYNFDVVFIGDDWKGTERWNNFEKVLAKVGVRVEYIPYTKGISTTMLREKIKSQEDI